MVWKDEIVEEVRAIRDQHAKKFAYNLDAIYNDLKRQEQKNVHKKVVKAR